MSVNSFENYPLTWIPPWCRGEAPKPQGALYLAIAAALEADIRSGALPVGTKLPPQRELADFLDLNFTTLTHAYDICRAKNLIYGIVGRGTFVAEPSDASARKEASNLIDLGAVQAFPSVGKKEIVAAAQAVLARDSASYLFDYSFRNGQPRHLRAGQVWLRKMAGLDVPLDQIAVFPGVQSALAATLLSVFSVGDTLATDPFTYANLIQLAHLAHIRLIPIASDELGMSPTALDTAARKFNLRSVFLMPECANPTTLTLEDNRRDALAEVCARHKLLVLEDSASLDPAAVKRTSFFSRLPTNTIYFAGSTRFISSGLRVTFVALPPTLKERVIAGLHHTFIKASALDAEIISELILTGAADRILQEKIKCAHAANEAFNKTFHLPRFAQDARLFRTLPLLGTAGHGPEIEQKYRAAGVVVCHSDRFAVAHGAKDAFLRLSLSSAPSPKQLATALNQISQV